MRTKTYTGLIVTLTAALVTELLINFARSVQVYFKIQRKPITIRKIEKTKSKINQVRRNIQLARSIKWLECNKEMEKIFEKVLEYQIEQLRREW